jgi:phosphate uptake regulator
METRKVQLAGGSTFTVSLPKQWASEHNIEAGDQLRLYPHEDGSLVVRGEDDPDSESSETTAAKVPTDHRSRTDIARIVQALYSVGFDASTLTGFDSTDTRTRRTISAVARRLIGLEVVEETENRMTLRTLLNPTDVSIRQTVIQLQLVALSMQHDAVTALERGDTELAKHVIERDDEADRLFRMVDRHFQRALSDLQEVDRLGVDRPEFFGYYTTARNLERVADHAEKVAAITIRVETAPEAVIEDIVAFAHRSQDIVEDAASVLLAGGDVDVAYGALAARDELTAELETFDRRLYREDIPDAYLFGLVLDSINRTAEYGGNIAEGAIQQVLRAKTEEAVTPEKAVQR